jgi:FkbH-like protein
MLRDLTFDLISLLLTFIPMALSGALLAGLLSIGGWAGRWQWFQWILAAPLLYMIWLIILLAIWAITMSRLGRKRPKPRYVVFRATGGGRLGRTPEMTIAGVAYRRLAIIGNMPLIRVLEASRVLRLLVYHAYSPRVQFGRQFTNMGSLHDPDLTEVGDNVVIGGRAVVEAHAVSARGDGTLVYVSAPVKLGNGVTVGGVSHVALGCVMGPDSILETGSVLAPFTNVPPGEVWGGNPARFLRKRAELEAREQSAQVISTAAAQNSAIPAGSGELRLLVADALKLSASETSGELSADTCFAWDSLGQVAIAAAIYDHYGVTIDAAQLFRLRTLDDIQAVLAGRTQAQSQSEAPEIPEDIEMLPLLDSGEATSALARRAQKQTSAGARLRFVIGASFTALPVETSLKLWGRAFGLDLDCHFTGYGRVLDDLLDKRSEFSMNRDGINAILVRPEDVSAPQLEQILNAIAAFASNPAGSGQFLVGSLPPVVSSFSSSDSRVIETLRSRWRTRLEEIPQVQILDFAGVVERLGIENARSPQSEILTRGPYSPRLYQNLGIAFVREILSRRRSPAKVLAIDCDNTLWGGVLGEVGAAAIQIGTDGRGRSFRLLQEYLKRLKERGVLLVVLSRNEASDVREVFENHPEMVLRPGDITAWRVNWKHKSENLQDVAADLGLALDSFVFVDDDPAVRAEMRARLPQVHVVPLPQDHSEWCGALSRLWLFDGGQSTTEDSSRTRMMQEEEQRRHEQKSAATLEEFLTSLELAVEVGTPEGPEWARVAQLTQRTNQFNSSLKRRTVEEVTALSPDAAVLILKVRDRFGDYGLTGLAIMRQDPALEVWEIDTLLMSCRVLGRGVEDAFLHAMAETAAFRGARFLRAPFTPGPRNGQVREFFARHNFEESEKNTWEIPLSRRPVLPPHVRLHWRDKALSAVL